MKSIGLAPIAHPPGKETLDLPNLAINGPKTKIPALIVFTNYKMQMFLFFFELLIFTVFLSLDKFNFDPKDFNKFIIVSISFTFGKFFKINFFI